MVALSAVLTVVAGLALPIGLFGGVVPLIWVSLGAALAALALVVLVLRRRGPAGG